MLVYLEVPHSVQESQGTVIVDLSTGLTYINQLLYILVNYLMLIFSVLMN